MSEPLRVLVAPDKFKGSLTAEEAARAMAAGITSCVPTVEVQCLPVADGGEGTVGALVAAGAVEEPVEVQGPLDERVEASFARIGRTAFIESARACGLQLLSPTEQTALTAHTFGVGELILAALDRGCDEVVIGIGGVASTDGGAGMAAALGVAFVDEQGDRIRLGGGELRHLHHIDMSSLDPRVRSTRFVAACDVISPLVGPDGAAAVFAPQKGASSQAVRTLGRALERYSDVLHGALGTDVADRPGAGAAGGLGGGLMAFLNARVVPGSDLILERVGFADALGRADLVMTGEGKLDRQTLAGKAPVAVARWARDCGVPAVAVAGAVDADVRDDLPNAFDLTFSMIEEVGEARALSRPVASLTAATAAALRAYLSTAREDARRSPEQPVDASGE